MAVLGSGPLLILPQGSTSAARVECVGCGGSIPVDLDSARVRALVEGLETAHVCPDLDQA